MSANTVFADVGAEFVKATTSWSEPRLWTFSANASTNEFTFVNVAMLFT
jgi:hypothetical protein